MTIGLTSLIKVAGLKLTSFLVVYGGDILISSCLSLKQIYKCSIDDCDDHSYRGNLHYIEKSS